MFIKFGKRKEKRHCGSFYYFKRPNTYGHVYITPQRARGELENSYNDLPMSQHPKAISLVVRCGRSSRGVNPEGDSSMTMGTPRKTRKLSSTRNVLEGEGEER